MYKKDSKGDPVVAVVTASLGAGVATSFAVAQGQSPFVALGITIFAGLAAFLLERAGLV
jgi:hypothetical protein